LAKSKIIFPETGGIDIELRGARRIFSLRRHLILTESQLKKIEIVKQIKKPKLWKKVSGSNGWYYGGWFLENGENEFWDVLNFEYVLKITTENFKYKKIFIEIDKDFKLEN
jgi:hypothetical protein